MRKNTILLGSLFISLIYIDLFCGAGGTSTGVESAKVHNQKCAKVIACINHDKNAIASHAANHPKALHFTEDIRTLDLTELIAHTQEMRKKYPFAKLVLGASLECTNHSKAKGGMSRDADSRTLADHLFRYIEALDPDSVQIENVEEFMIWGPLEIKEIHNEDSSYCPLEVVVIDKSKKLRELRPVWIPIKERKGESYNAWVEKLKFYKYNFDFRILNSADFGALTSRKRYFAQFNKSGFPIVWPEATHTKNPVSGLFGNLHKWKAVKEVLDFEDEGVSIFGRKKDLVEASLTRIWQGLVKFVAGGKDKHTIENNSTLKNSNGVSPGTEAKFFFNQYGNSSVSSIENPSGTITTTPKQNLVICKKWILNTNFKNVGSSISSPMPTITANRKWHYLMDAQYSRIGNSIDQPCFTLIARMDKTPPYLIEITQDGEIPAFIKIVENTVVYEIYADDSPMLKKIKEFMAFYGLIDIKMRMLRIQELLEIMGFPKDYVLIGNQADQKKFIGNAVEVTIARKICEAIANRLYEYKQAA